MDKVAAAKQYIENHYKTQMKNIQERKERRKENFLMFRSRRLGTYIGHVVSRKINFNACQIVHWRKHLKFREDSKLSFEAKDLICRLLCDVEQRLGTAGAEQIKAHPWFRDVLWDKLYEMEAAFRPEVNGELDTENFMKFDELNPPTPARTRSGQSRKMLSTPKDLSFMGYTYKNFDAVKALQNSSDLISRPPTLRAIESIHGDSNMDQKINWKVEEPDIQMLTSISNAMSP